jgi:hypothetical protein
MLIIIGLCPIFASGMDIFQFLIYGQIIWYKGSPPPSDTTLTSELPLLIVIISIGLILVGIGWYIFSKAIKEEKTLDGIPISDINKIVIYPLVFLVSGILSVGVGWLIASSGFSDAEYQSGLDARQKSILGWGGIILVISGFIIIAICMIYLIKTRKYYKEINS